MATLRFSCIQECQAVEVRDAYRICWIRIKAFDATMGKSACPLVFVSGCDDEAQSRFQGTGGSPEGHAIGDAEDMAVRPFMFNEGRDL